MSSILVDSNVLIDAMAPASDWYDWSVKTLKYHADHYRLLINPIIYAEVSIRFASIEDADVALPQAMFTREPLPYEAAFLAGKAFVSYRRSGGVKISPLPDFYIGAHAAIAGYQIMTRDPTRYRTYFPKLKLISP